MLNWVRKHSRLLAASVALTSLLLLAYSLLRAKNTKSDKQGKDPNDHVDSQHLVISQNQQVKEINSQKPNQAPQKLQKQEETLIKQIQSLQKQPQKRQEKIQVVQHQKLDSQGRIFVHTESLVVRHENGLLQEVNLDQGKSLTYEKINSIQKSGFGYSIINYRAFFSPPSLQQKAKSQQLKKILFEQADSGNESMMGLIALSAHFSQQKADVIISSESTLQSKLTMAKLTIGFVQPTPVIEQKKLAGSFQQVSQSPTFFQDTRLRLARQLGLTQDQIIIYSICEGSIKVEYSVSGKMELHNYFKKFSLSPSDFDTAGNYDFTSAGEIQSRAGWPYYQPHGSKRFGLKVTKQYDGGDDSWLSMNEIKGMWAVAYHGVNYPGQVTPSSKKVLQSIMAGRQSGSMLIAGSGQAHKNNICKRSGKVVGQGIYCSPHVQVSQQGYAQPIQVVVKGVTRNYKLVLQCRVKPDAIRVCSRDDYWVINSPKDIRPYGILLFQNSFQKKRVPSNSQQFNYAGKSKQILDGMKKTSWLP